MMNTKYPDDRNPEESYNDFMNESAEPENDEFTDVRAEPSAVVPESPKMRICICTRQARSDIESDQIMLRNVLPDMQTRVFVENQCYSLYAIEMPQNEFDPQTRRIVIRTIYNVEPD